MDKNLKVLKKNVIGDGEFVNCLKMSSYGKHYLIQYRTTRTMDVRYNQYLNYAVTSIDQNYAMIVDEDGKIVAQPQLLNTQVSPSDDVESLSDGKVAWTSVDDKTGKISFHSYGPPS